MHRCKISFFCVSDQGELYLEVEDADESLLVDGMVNLKSPS